MTIEERAKAYYEGDLELLQTRGWLDRSDIADIVEKAYIQGATEQKAIDDAEKKKLIEKVIWLIEESYPDVDSWSHNALVRNVTADLETRADMLRGMFD